ncbi:hypothetical protein L7F22_016894 [Adiantum nelumboides]|nr:hypothetical protein [Adiantum nelumboides]
MAEEEDEEMVELSSFKLRLRAVVDASEDILLLWALGRPHLTSPNCFVCQAAQSLRFDSCGHTLTMWQAPSAFNKPGVTGAVMWDSAVVLGKFLEHCHDIQVFNMRRKSCVELGAGCGFVGCVAALLGAEVTLTDLPGRMRQLQKNVIENTMHVGSQLSARVEELTWGEELDKKLTSPPPDFNVVYSEEVVDELLRTLIALCGSLSTVILAAELRNDAVLEYFLELCLKDFLVWRVPQSQWHPDFRSQRVAIYIMTKPQSQRSVG